MATEAAKTLAEIAASSLLSEHAVLETLAPALYDDRANESEARASNGCKEGFNGDVHFNGREGVVIKTQVVETEITVKERFGTSNGDVLWEDKTENGGGSDIKVELDQSGTSLALDVQESLNVENVSGEDHRRDDGRSCSAENAEVAGEGLRKITEQASKMGGKHEVTRKEEGREENGEDRDVLNNDVQVDEGKDEKDVGDHEHGYLVGDFVWGKFNSHPWWPGQIYDPASASENAKKCKQKGRLLVVYFGDGSFSWCSPSQLKPFADHFEEMSKRSNLRIFLDAVQDALEELGGLVELKMTCSCISEGNRRGLTRQSTYNTGIKEGVLVPDCNLSRPSIGKNEPREILSTLRIFAEASSGKNMLELKVLRSWLSAFYRAKGGHKLVLYHEPEIIEGLEDKGKNGVSDDSDFNGHLEVQFQGPSEEVWVSLQENCGFGQTGQSTMQKCAGLSEDKLNQRKKKSVADLLKENSVFKPKPNKKKDSAVKNTTSSGKVESMSVKKKRKSSESSSISALNKVPSGKVGGNEGEEKTQDNDGGYSKEKSGKSFGGDEGEGKTQDNDGGRSEEKSGKLSASRERKKSKYLSPPFTNPNMGVRNFASKKYLEEEYVKTSKVARVGERMTRAAGQITGSLLNVKSSDTKSKKLRSNKHDNGGDTSALSSPRSPQGDKKKVIESVKVKASSKEVTSEARSAALDTRSLFESNSFDMIKDFISAYRSVIYKNGSNYRMYQNSESGRKRKYSSSGPGLEGKASNEASIQVPKSRPKKARKEKNEKAEKTIDKGEEDIGELLLIKKKLEKMTSMLENSDGNAFVEMKSNLEGEMKGLLEKVSAMVNSAST